MAATTSRCFDVRIETINARAFGPFKGAALTLSPDLTIIHGLNESGKSSWHAAIYAGLCGMRRARGIRGPEQQFSKRHRPWSGDAWRVDLILKLDNGRRVELRQNLADLADCHASDADFGGDISAEILNENTPDAAKWLGLDRNIFSDVACVRQAEILELVAGDVTRGLQDQIQKAAASTTRDATAAQAIDRLEQYQKEYVGLERANSTKPLQRAKHRLEVALHARQIAVNAHREWLSLETQAQQLRATALMRAGRYQQVLAYRATQEAEAWGVKLRRAKEISAKFPNPPTLIDQMSVAEEVSAALEQWEQRPEISYPQGESVAALRARIEALPAVPTEDLEPSPGVITLKKEFERASEAARFHANQQPVDPGVVVSRLSANAIRDLARDIELAIPPIDPSVESAYERAREQSERPSVTPASMSAGFAAVVVLLSIAGLLWSGHVALGAALAMGVLFTFAIFVLRRRPAPADATAMLAAIEAQRDQQRKTIESVRVRKDAAQARIRSEGLPGTAKELNALADAIVLAAERQKRLELWTTQRDALSAAIQNARLALVSELQGRGIADGSDPDSAFDQYVRACRDRSQQAMRAETKSGLLEQLKTKEASEASVADAERRNVAVSKRLLSLDHRLGGSATTDHQAAANLRAWRQQYSERVARFELDRGEYAELTAILDGRSLSEMEDLAEQSRDRAQKLAEQIRAAGGEALQIDPRLDLDVAQQESAAATRAAGTAEATVAERARVLTSVAEAEEEVERAQSEMARCRRLQSTLIAASTFLRNAEDKVNRDLAPVLAAGLRESLPAVTRGRYIDARVKPSDLSVELRDADNEWRDVWRLSHGTLEQVYLLLRVVLAKWLVTTGESCPLILDDVLVHCDRVRKLAILDTLKTISTSQQVVLFTQEDEVLRWAEASAPDQLIRLADPVGAT
jgi:DNA repair protein SbcC/Rad50